MLVAYAPSDYLEGEVRFYALFGKDLWDELWTRFPRVDDTNGISLWRHVAAHVLGAITLLDSAPAALRRVCRPIRKLTLSRVMRRPTVAQ